MKQKKIQESPPDNVVEPYADPSLDAEGADESFPKATSSIGALVTVLTQSKDGINPLHDDWKDVFLQALSKAPIIAAAAAVAGVSRTRATEERDADAEFARRWDDAIAQGIDELEAAAFVSAVYGDKRPVFHQGKRTGWTVEYSNAMRAMLLKAWRPEVFKDKDDPETDATKVMTLDEFRARVKQSKAP